MLVASAVVDRRRVDVAFVLELPDGLKVAALPIENFSDLSTETVLDLAKTHVLPELARWLSAWRQFSL